LGLEFLKAELKACMGFQGEREDSFMARQRHLQALHTTQMAIERAEEQLWVFNAGELMAEELRLAQDALGQITGKFTADDLLGEIFSSFCIGK
jgi:tRNA modification GTPase